MEKWTTPTKTIYQPLEPPVSRNRPKCGKNLREFIPPGTYPERGVRFAACEDTNCAGGGTILTNDTKCFTCYRVIPVGTPCPSLRVEDKSELRPGWDDTVAGEALRVVGEDGSTSGAVGVLAGGETHSTFRISTRRYEDPQVLPALRAVAGDRRFQRLLNYLAVGRQC